jgi:hypothetical protein
VPAAAPRAAGRLEPRFPFPFPVHPKGCRETETGNPSKSSLRSPSDSRRTLSRPAGEAPVGPHPAPRLPPHPLPRSARPEREVATSRHPPAGGGTGSGPSPRPAHHGQHRREEAPEAGLGTAPAPNLRRRRVALPLWRPPAGAGSGHLPRHCGGGAPKPPPPPASPPTAPGPLPAPAAPGHLTDRAADAEARGTSRRGGPPASMPSRWRPYCCRWQRRRPPPCSPPAASRNMLRRANRVCSSSPFCLQRQPNQGLQACLASTRGT